MSGSKKRDVAKQRKESKTSRITLYLAATLTVIVIAYLAYLILKPTVTPCEGVFQQTAASLQSNIEIFKVKAEILLINEQVQEISAQAQETALNLKTCCILFQGNKISFNQFIQCQNSFNAYQRTFDRVNTIVANAEAAKKKQALPADKSRLVQKLEKELIILDQNSKDLKQHVSESSSDDDEHWIEKETIINEIEPNNHFTEAMEISRGMVRGDLAEAENEDYYKLEVPHGHILKLAFTPDEEGESMFLELKNFERENVWYSGSVAPGVTKSRRVMMNSSSGGTYYIKVYGGSGRYEFELFTESQNDAGSAGDAGDRITKALQIEPGRSFSGELGGFDKGDWYRFTPVEGQLISFTHGEEGGSMLIDLKNFERKDVWFSGSVAPGVTKSFRISEVVMPPYFIKIYSGSGKYTFEIK
jgi:hypothetical protein